MVIADDQGWLRGASWTRGLLAGRCVTISELSQESCKMPYQSGKH